MKPTTAEAQASAVRATKQGMPLSVGMPAEKGHHQQHQQQKENCKEENNRLTAAKAWLQQGRQQQQKQLKDPGVCNSKACLGKRRKASNHNDASNISI
jgi:hypothetical protein